MQRHNGVALTLGGEVLHISARLGISTVVPTVTITVLCLYILKNGVVNGQVQRHYRVTAMYILQYLRVVARCIVGHPIPSVGIAAGLIVLSSVTMIHYQMQGDSRVAAICSNECPKIVARFGIAHAIPFVSVTNRQRYLFTDRLVNHDSILSHIITPSRHGNLNGIC